VGARGEDYGCSGQARSAVAAVDKGRDRRAVGAVMADGALSVRAARGGQPVPLPALRGLKEVLRRSGQSERVRPGVVVNEDATKDLGRF